MTLNKYNLILIAGLSVIALGGCSHSTKEKLGLTRQSPDEFAIIKRAPLAIPTNYKLIQPRPGAKRPQEKEPIEQARETTFGKNITKTNKTSTVENIILQKTTGGKSTAGIRKTVDRESAAIKRAELPVAEKLLGIGSKKNAEPGATIINAKAEAERIQKNIKEGKPVTNGETPTIEE